ncbi:MAG: PQQ-binding-like beta-propeller repeat protein [Actinomycetota bacterium]
MQRPPKSVRSPRRPGPPLPFATIVAVLAVIVLLAVGARALFGGDDDPGPGLRRALGEGSTEPAVSPTPDGDRGQGSDDENVDAAGVRTAPPIGTEVTGLTTFRGNATRTYYGEGPLPSRPRVLWRYPPSGGLCSQSTNLGETTTWCGTGWTGQPNVLVNRKGDTEVRIGAYDSAYHFIDGKTGEAVKPAFQTGDLAKGSATSDPDGYPLYYAGSRDDEFRILSTQKRKVEELWSINAETSVPGGGLWNDDWDAAALVIDDYLLEGGENSYFYVIKLNRGYAPNGDVTVDPRVVTAFPGYDDELLSSIPDDDVSIETSPSFHDGVVYFANSGGLVQGWDISKILRGESDTARRVFRFWTGDDTDGSIAIDDEGMLYVASELQRFNATAARNGQLMKLDPSKRKPLVWSVPVTEQGSDGLGGIWATPAIYGDMVYVTTNYGELLGVDKASGKVRWRIKLPAPLWSSPVPIDGVLLQGDCLGRLHAYDIASNPRREPKELWDVKLSGCIESTPAVWDGMIYVGTRSGGIYGIGDKRS